MSEQQKRGRGRPRKEVSTDAPKSERKPGRPPKPNNPENETAKINFYPPQWLVDAVDSLQDEGLLPENWSRSEVLQFAMSELVRQLTGAAPGEIKRRWGGKRTGERWLTPPDFVPPSMVYRGAADLPTDEDENSDILDQYPDFTETNSWAYQWLTDAGKWERSTSVKSKKHVVDGANFTIGEGRKARILFNGKVIKTLKPDNAR
jgi:hypothetical protein